MTSINPYITFNGQCREAMEFYQQALGGELELKTFEEGNMQVRTAYTHRIMHAVLRFEDAVLMASDSMPGQDALHGNSVTISISATNLDKAKGYFINLAQNGDVTMPFQQTSWGAMFGMLTDQFGFNWMINCERS